MRGKADVFGSLNQIKGKMNDENGFWEFPEGCNEPVFAEGLKHPVIVASYSEQDNSKIGISPTGNKSRERYMALTESVCLVYSENCLSNSIPYKDEKYFGTSIQVYDYFSIAESVERKYQEQIYKARVVRERNSAVQP